MDRSAIIREFRSALGSKNVFSDAADLVTYSYDAAVLDQSVPTLAVRPTSIEKLGRAVAICSEHGIPLTVRGAGTNLSGGTIPQSDGVVVLTGALNHIIEINEEDMYAVVEPGVITAGFASAVEARGLFYPPDPGSQAVSTLGGNVAENAGGLRGLKYGVTGDYVMGLEFFDADGQMVKTGSRTVKCVTGYNLGGIMVGSEGTLGVISRIILKLIPPPAASRSMMAIFDRIEAAAETVSAIIAGRIIPATLEFMDNFTIRRVEEFSRVGLPVDAAALLLIEVDGHPAQVDEDAEEIIRICARNKADRIQTAENAEQKDQIWEARRAALSALARARPTTVLEDATVPRSKIPQMVAAMHDIARRHDLAIGTFGHAGDGNLHPTILCDRRDRQEWQRVEKAVADIFETALSLGGTLSGEHGIGLAKAAFLEQEVGRPTMDWSLRLKRAMDPKSILNPRKIFR